MKLTPSGLSRTTTGLFVSLAVFATAGSDTLTRTGDVTVSGTPTPGGYAVVDTGQAQCYDTINLITAPTAGQPFYGQDAQFSGTQPSYTKSSDGLTVKDNVTGLTWSQSPDTNGDGAINASDKMTLTQAQARPSILNAAKFGGYSDWRLPTIKELYSLMNFMGTDVGPGSDVSTLTPFIDRTYFSFGYGDTAAGERVLDAQYASSTLYVSKTMLGDTTLFGVNFADGRIKGYGLTMSGGGEKTFYVQCVRGAGDGVNDFLDNGDATITDQATGLMWTQGDSGTGMSWQDALAWAQSKNAENYLGHNDWRVPNAKELHSIVDYTRSPDTTSSAAISPLFTCSGITNEAGKADYPFYWTGTTHISSVGTGANAIYIAFGRALGYMTMPNNPTIGAWLDVHGAGAQRSDPKAGNPADYPKGLGPQGDAIRIYNYVRLVRDALCYAVVDTCQPQCYDNTTLITAPTAGQPFYGQDAQFSGTQPSYAKSGDRLTVKDNVTGLTWSQSHTTKQVYWAEAQAVATAMNAANYGGYSDWRLPTIKELYSLWNGNTGWPYIDTNYFTISYASENELSHAIFWSSSKYSGLLESAVDGNVGAALAFGVNFGTGHIKAYSIASGPRHLVRCVRGASYGINNFRDLGDGSVTDQATGLMWARTDSGSGMDWEHALAYAQTQNAANYLGHSDWRLPNTKELQSLVDYTRSPGAADPAHVGPAIDPLFTCTGITNEGGDADYPWYWTGTSAKVSANEANDAAWYVAFGRAVGSDGKDLHGAGAVRFDEKAIGVPGGESRYFNYVRLVRDAWTHYTLTFDAQGGSVSPATKSITSGLAYGNLPRPLRTGYAFGGWWTGAEGAGSEVTAATAVSVASDQTLYAKWLSNQPPVFTKRSPAAAPAAVSEGASVAFSVTADDSTDPETANRGMSNIAWYVDGVLKRESRTGAPKAITGAFTLKTDAATVWGAAFRDVQVEAVALDKLGGTTGTAWTVRVNNVAVSQAITFPVLPVKVLGDPDFAPGATASSGLPVVYSSSSPSVVQIVDGVAHIVSAGTAVITAAQPGNSDFKAAAQMSKSLTVKARLSTEVPSGGGTVTGAGLYLPGTKVTLTAKPNTGNTLLQWEDGSQALSRSLVMPSANRAVSAVFKPTASVTAPLIAAPGPQQAMVGVFFTQRLDIASESLPTVTVTGLPAGLGYSSATRTISGVPTVAVTSRSVTIKVKNANPATVTTAFTLSVSPLPAWAQGSFSGWFDTGASGLGPVSANVTALGKVTGKLTSSGTNYAFSAAAYSGRDEDGSFWIAATVMSGKLALPLTFAVRNPAGSVPPSLAVVDGWFADKSGGDPEAKLYRNVWKDTGMAAVMTNSYTGYYTAALPGAAAYGSGYLSFTVDKSGGVKTTGKLADGTAVSLAGTLVLDENGRVFTALYTSPAAYKGGCLFGLAEFFKASAGEKAVVRLLDGGPMLWVSGNPQATEVYGAGFSRELGITGGWYDTLGNLYRYYAGKGLSVGTEGAPIPGTVVGTNRYDSVFWDPDGLSLFAVTNSLGVMTGLAAPRAGVPVKAGTGGYDYAAGTNAVGLTVSLARATGLFKGSFKAWFDYANTHTAKSLSYEGVLTPVREDASDGVEGRGFFLWADKASYENPQGKTVPYSFNGSYDFLLLSR